MAPTKKGKGIPIANAASSNASSSKVVPAASSVTSGADNSELELVPHLGNATLDAPYDRDGMYIIHNQSGERVALPRGVDWELTFLDDGFAFLLDREDKQPALFLEDLFSRVVCFVTDGDLIAVAKDTKPRQFFDLSQRMRTQQYVCVKLPVAPTFKQHEWDVALLQMPRARCMFRWSFHSMYDNLGMDTYDGERSSWFYNSALAFQNLLLKHGLGSNHILRALHGNTKLKNDVDESPFMTWPTISTTGMLCLLAKYATHVPQVRQSVRAAMLPQASRYHLQSMVVSSLRTQGTRPFHVEVRFQDTWKDKWPASHSQAPDVVLLVDRSGMLDIQPWIDFTRQKSPNRCANKWWQEMYESQLVEHGSLRVCFSQCFLGLICLG